jgi:hypothetical protein
LVLALIWGGVVPAFAFQEVPAPPPLPSGEAVPQAKPPALALGTPGGGLDAADDEGGLHVFGYDLMPQLDFGLELLYGQNQQHMELQSLDTFEGAGDVTVLGKVKRRF